MFKLRCMPTVVLQTAIFFSLFLSTVNALAASVDKVRIWPAPDHTRFVLDLSGPVEHNFFTLPDPPRLVIDIEGSRFLADLNNVELSNTPIKNIRTAVNNNTLRVVLDMKETVDTNFFALKKMGDINDRLVLDMEYRSGSAVAKPTVVVEDPTTNGRRDLVIAIVAGHGGEDPGAIGPGRLYEKDVTLKIAKQLAEMINAAPGYKAVMVRTGDYGVGLRKRREMARQNRADLFVAIHADAFKHKSANGASVYALNMNGRLATSETARYLAERENESDLIGGVGSVSIKGMDEDVASTIMSLSQSATLSSSLQAGQYILDALGGVARLHKKQVEQADFMVLRAPDMPSLLIETGFISNPGEAKRLSTFAYRKKMAQSIFAGVKNYFYNYPPPGTYVAWQKENGGRESEHIISRGETLSGIAIRYQISVSDLVSFNQLKNTNIRIGQKLKIPST